MLHLEFVLPDHNINEKIGKGKTRNFRDKLTDSLILIGPPTDVSLSPYTEDLALSDFLLFPDRSKT